MNRYGLIVEGRVQGVGFRAFVEQIGRHHNMTGTVQNLANGNVRVEVQGEKKAFAMFMSDLKQENHFSHITAIHTEELDVKKDERRFRVVY
ncbi:acylphosphate phosphohydrolase [Bacillus sp. JCM 19047]|nr:acylphosphate phosphohydrolase [Bacillus sp. JCM 19047]